LLPASLAHSSLSSSDSTRSGAATQSLSTMRLCTRRWRSIIATRREKASDRTKRGKTHDSSARCAAFCAASNRCGGSGAVEPRRARKAEVDSDELHELVAAAAGNGDGDCNNEDEDDREDDENEWRMGGGDDAGSASAARASS
jgi:hypothetical protein